MDQGKAGVQPLRGAAKSKNKTDTLIIDADDLEDVGINDLIAAANKGDRLLLLNDSSVPEGNLDNPIHPIFRGPSFLRRCRHLKQCLQLASLFLCSDAVLEFFIPLTFGRTRTDSRTKREYLSCPVASKPKSELQPYLGAVREAICCLEHSVVFRWDCKYRVWGRTFLWDNRKPPHQPDCTKRFDYKGTAVIELCPRFLAYYTDETNGYSKASRCDRFRHDFQAATTLVHELVHAYGIMVRGTLKEPYIRLDHPGKSEWGFAWENFMFGGIINPQDRTIHGTHIQLRKTWQDDEKIPKNGGREYSAIPVKWTAQWFRKETWEKIEREGPLSIKPAVTRLKIRGVPGDRWVVETDMEETREDVCRRYRKARARALDIYDRVITRGAAGDQQVNRSVWALVDEKFLQKSNVPIPMRVPPKPLSAVDAYQRIAKRKSVAALELSDSSDSSSQASSSASSFPSSGTSRKRRADTDEEHSIRPKKMRKFSPTN